MKLSPCPRCAAVTMASGLPCSRCWERRPLGVPPEPSLTSLVLRLVGCALAGLVLLAIVHGFEREPLPAPGFQPSFAPAGDARPDAIVVAAKPPRRGMR